MKSPVVRKCSAAYAINMKSVLLGALLAFSLSVPAAAREGHQIAVALDVNSGAIIQIGDDGTGVAGLEGEKLAPPTPWVRMVARHLTSGRFDWATGKNAAAVSDDDMEILADPVVAGEIHVAFRQIGESDHRLLVIANGYDRALTFRASIRVSGEEEHTDVCTVMPGIHGVEHWPFASDRIMLTDLRLEEWREGTPPRCE